LSLGKGSLQCREQKYPCSHHTVPGHELDLSSDPLRALPTDAQQISGDGCSPRSPRRQMLLHPLPTLCSSWRWHQNPI